jgi:hypothetical protein
MLDGSLTIGATIEGAMDTFTVVCPFCGEEVEIFIEADVRGTFIQDCEVCCNPWLVRAGRSLDGTDVIVERGDE